MGRYQTYTSLRCRWQTRATRHVSGPPCCTQMSTVSVINWWLRPSTIHHTDRPPKFLAPETISRSRVMVGAQQNLNGSCDLTTPILGRFLIRGLAHATIKLPTKFEVSISIHYKDMKSDIKCQNVAVWGSLGSFKVTENSTNRYSTCKFLLAFHSNCPYLAPFLRYSEILVENRRFNLPHLYLAPPLGMIPLEFLRDF